MTTALADTGTHFGLSRHPDSEYTAITGMTPRASAARHRWSPSSQTWPCLRYAVLSCASLRKSLSKALSRELMS